MCWLSKKSGLNETTIGSLTVLLLNCDVQVPPWFDLKARDGHFSPLTL